MNKSVEHTPTIAMLIRNTTAKTKQHKKTFEKAISSVTFSFNVREEMSGIIPERRCCREAMLASFLFSGGKLNKGRDERFLEVTTGISRAARLIYKLLRDVAEDAIGWEKEREKFLMKRNVYHIFAPNTPAMQDFVERWGITGKLQRRNMRRACCRRAFLAGAFLSSGSINSPHSFYHFEIVQKDPDIARILVKILARMEVNAKIIKRRGRHVVYLKKADEIANLLNILGAHGAAGCGDILLERPGR